MTNAIDTVPHWLDPTVDFAGERQGLTGDLVASCIQLFVALVRGPRREGLEDEDLGQLRLQAQTFSLWCDGFDAESGGLDAIIARSEELRDTLLRLLSAVGAALVNLAKRPVLDLSNEQSIFSDLKSECEQCIQLIERASEPTDPQDENEDCSDSSTSDLLSAASNEADLKDLVGELVLYNDLLVDLVPALRSSAESDPFNTITTSINNQIQLEDTPARTFNLSIINYYPLVDKDLAIRLGEANFQRLKRLARVLERRMT